MDRQVGYILSKGERHIYIDIENVHYFNMFNPRITIPTNLIYICIHITVFVGNVVCGDDVE